MIKVFLVLILFFIAATSMYAAVTTKTVKFANGTEGRGTCSLVSCDVDGKVYPLKELGGSDLLPLGSPAPSLVPDPESVPDPASASSPDPATRTDAEKEKAWEDTTEAAKEGMPTYEERNAADQAALNSITNPPIDTSTDNMLGVPANELKTGEVSMDTIPKVIVNVITTLLGVAGTVAVFSLIYHAVQMQINSGITGDSSGVDKAKKGMTGALIGFIIAISAWFLVTQAVTLLGDIT